MESPFKADIVKGKVGLITGGGSGIGFEISKQFGKHGASVAIMGRRKPVLDAAVSDLQSLGIRVIYSNSNPLPPIFFSFVFLDFGCHHMICLCFSLISISLNSRCLGVSVWVFSH